VNSIVCDKYGCGLETCLSTSVLGTIRLGKKILVMVDRVGQKGGASNGAVEPGRLALGESGSERRLVPLGALDRFAQA